MRVVYATTTCTVTLPGGGHMPVREGSHWPADDPLVLAHPEFFSDDPTSGLTYSRKPAEDAPVEQATAAPGERRNVRRSS